MEGVAHPLLTGTVEAKARHRCAQQGLTNSETGAGGKEEPFIPVLATGEDGAPHPRAHGGISVQAEGVGGKERESGQTPRAGRVGKFSAADSTVCSGEDLVRPWSAVRRPGFMVEGQQIRGSWSA